jgi:hypothetical protein
MGTERSTGLMFTTKILLKVLNGFGCCEAMEQCGEREIEKEKEMKKTTQQNNIQ